MPMTHRQPVPVMKAAPMNHAISGSAITAPTAETLTKIGCFMGRRSCALG
jgi:hypothetical protein